MDTDLSHEALQRFEAIEARLDKLDGGNEEETDDEEDVEEEDQEDEGAGGIV